MEHSLAPKASQIHSLVQELHMHFPLDRIHEEQREQRLPNPLAVELLRRTLKFLFWDYYFQVYQRCKSGSFLSLSALLCWLHHTKIAIPKITVYSCLTCRKCKSEQQYMVYVYANARVNVLERPFKITATTVRERIIPPPHTLRELQLWEGEAEDNVCVCVSMCVNVTLLFKAWFYGLSVFSMSWDRNPSPSSFFSLLFTTPLLSHI